MKWKVVRGERMELEENKEADLDKEEVEKIIKSLKNGKAEGGDNSCKGMEIWKERGKIKRMGVENARKDIERKRVNKRVGGGNYCSGAKKGRRRESRRL